MSIDLSKLLTERRNANSANIDTLSTLDMLTVINQEDQRMPANLRHPPGAGGGDHRRRT